MGRDGSGVLRSTVPFALVSTLAAFSALAACGRSVTAPRAARVADAAPPTAASAEGAPAALAEIDAGVVETAQAGERDGNDDEEDPGSGKAPATGHWEKVGTAPLALSRICDLTPLGDALYAAHANQPLGTDGATITRYRPDDPRPFTVAFDWNRPGEPTKGGGAGQGFLRVHAIGGRLFVPDSDPPYAGFGFVDHGTEGYVFVSDDHGKFAPARSPHFLPPASAGVVPRAYHVLDVIEFRGGLYTSTGSVPPSEHAWRGPSPGALHRANESGSRWTYEVDYPFPWQDGVWRLTYMVRFKGRLYAGIQDFDRRDPNDYVVFTPPEGASALHLHHDDAHPTRATRSGGAATLRWWVDTRVKPARLYWLAWTADGIGLRVTTDGDHWAEIGIPPDAGRPTDVTRLRDSVVMLAERGLYRLSGPAIDGAAPLDVSDGVADANATLIAPAVEPTSTNAKKPPKTPFEVSDFMCVAPLAVLHGTLYAGGQRGGTLYRLAD
jgi:hypothetical protein